MNTPFKNFYGRVAGHLSKKSRDLLEGLLFSYLIDKEKFFSKDASKLTEEDAKSNSNLILVKGKFQKINLEIGFGSGDFIFGQASKNHQDFYLGVEVFQNGIASLLTKLENNPLSNLKIYNQNVYMLFELMEANTFNNIYILFPDPWPKARHHKRRIMNLDNLGLFHKILKPGGELRFVSDYEEYVDFVLNNLANSNTFLLASNNKESLKVKPLDHIETKYERKAIKKKTPIFYLSLRVNK